MFRLAEIPAPSPGGHVSPDELRVELTDKRASVPAFLLRCEIDSEDNETCRLATVRTKYDLWLSDPDGNEGIIMQVTRHLFQPMLSFFSVHYWLLQLVTA